MKDYISEYLSKYPNKLDRPNVKVISEANGVVTLECPCCYSQYTIKAVSYYADLKLCISCSRRVDSLSHGGCGTKLYGVWSAMKGRCSNINAVFYKYYGGKGVKVCDEWKNDFLKFREWAFGSGYSEDGGLTIDRIDNNGDYEPSNCRWVDRKFQMANRGKSSLFSGRFIGVSNVSGSWTAEITNDYTCQYLGSYRTELEAARNRDLYIWENGLADRYVLNGVLSDEDLWYVRYFKPKKYKNNKTGFTGVFKRPERDKYRVEVRHMGSIIFRKEFKDKVVGAFAREEYIIKHGIPHRRNFTDEEFDVLRHKYETVEG